MLSLPLVFYPNKLIWVDDDELFLQAITKRFENTYKIKTFASSEVCLEFFQNYHSALSAHSFLRGYVNHEDYDLIDHLPMDINLGQISDLLNNAQRFEDVSVMIIDHHLPKLTGIEICYELRHLPIKKILLTGDSNHNQVINAFNEGIIDCFVQKDNLMLVQDLMTHISRLQTSYFVNMTKPLLFYLETEYKLALSDPAFIAFFYKWCQLNQVSEYYIMDKNGTILTIDKNGKAKYFVIHTEQTLDAFVQLYAEDDDVSQFICSITNRNKIPFFGIRKESWHYDFTQWAAYMHTPNILDGRERYYWVVVAEKDQLIKKAA